MRISLNEIQIRALAFSKRWADASDKAAQAKTFWLDFFGIFGNTDKRVPSFEDHDKKLGDRPGFIDVFYPVYNDLPWPDATGHAVSDKYNQAIERCAQAVLDARAQFPEASLADLYDSLSMPPALLKAHQKLDAAVDKTYEASGGKKEWKNDADRVAFLFTLNEQAAGLLTAAKPAKQKRTPKE